MAQPCRHEVTLSKNEDGTYDVSIAMKSLSLRGSPTASIYTLAVMKLRSKDKIDCDGIERQLEVHIWAGAHIPEALANVRKEREALRKFKENSPILL